MHMNAEAYLFCMRKIPVIFLFIYYVRYVEKYEKLKTF